MVKPYWWNNDFNGDSLAFDFGNTIATGTNPFTDDFLFQNVNSGVDGPGGVWLINGGGASVDPGGQIAVGGGAPWDILGSANFTTDQHPDLIEQNDTNGSVRIEFLGGQFGTTVLDSTIVENSTGTAALVPGTDWHLAGTGVFDPFDQLGQPGGSPGQGSGFGPVDLLFQNTATGAVGEWYLTLPSGGHVLAENDPQGGIHTVGASPGPTWHVVGADDFAFQTAPIGTTPFLTGTSGNVETHPNSGAVGGIQYDIFFQNDNGAMGVWHVAGEDGNNNPVVSDVEALPNPGPTWHLISVQGDFNDDGTNDLLFQNNNGAEGIWLMNGSVDGVHTPTVSGFFSIGNPGSGWQVVGAGDYDGDHVVDDIRLQNSSTGQIEDQLLGNSPGAGQVGAPGVTATPTIVATNVIDGNPGTTWHLLHDDFLLNT
jgi:hypothetical protein